MWQDKNNYLYKKFEFNDFKQAFKFMAEVAKAAEQQQHHPKWLNEWNIVEIWLSTHEDDNKVTDKDTELAKLIDKVHEEYK
jgi:4a-hydroxytetrahydrobiopterin dehydratase